MMEKLGALAVVILLVNLPASDSKSAELCDAPIRLHVGHHSHTSVSLSWKFNERREVKPGRQRFDYELIERTADGFARVKSNGPFYGNSNRHRIRNLKPKTRYRVTLFELHEDGGKGENATTYFRTREHDWPRPSISNIKVDERDDRVDYTLTWSLGDGQTNPWYQEIKFCANKCDCDSLRIYGRETKKTIVLKYSTEYTVTLYVYYYDTVLEAIERGREIRWVYFKLRPPIDMKSFHETERRTVRIENTEVALKSVGVDYTLSWSVDSEDAPSYFNIEYCSCANECNSLEAAPEETKRTISLKYCVPYSVTVYAVFEDPNLGTFRRRSQDIGNVRFVPDAAHNSLKCSKGDGHGSNGYLGCNKISNTDDERNRVGEAWADHIECARCDKCKEPIEDEFAGMDVA